MSWPTRPPLPCSVREMTEPERAWVGAMVEAEGSVTERPTKSHHTYRDWVLQLANTDFEITSALLRTTGVGHVYWAEPPTGTRPQLHWRVNRKLDLLDLQRQLAPYCMKIRRLEYPS